MAAPTTSWKRLPTEAIDRRNRDLDRLPLGELVSLMATDNVRVVAAVKNEARRIAKAAGIIATSVQKGGRVLMVGAGTSGRLGLLEAAEMPPTFGVSPSTVQAALAGGPRAVYRAVEGAEDDMRAGEKAVAGFKPGRADVIVGISASGVTPFVAGALARARRAGSRIVTVTCDRRSPLAKLSDVTIALSVGPEVVAGSTRLKAGTATKMALNIMTTAAMIRVGKTYGNLMVDVKATNRKLRDRASRIIQTATGLGPKPADALLARAAGSVKAAIVMHKAGLSRADAVARLRASDDSVRKALSRSR
jgi:N-acetylmuramic acid 6-phosphate etherase